MRLKLRPIGANQTELYVEKITVLFSYETPVAFHQEGAGYYRTKQHYSSTTTRHINQWLYGVEAAEVPQDFIDECLKVTK